MIRRLGICGAIGSGKSHVAAVLARERGYVHLSADTLFKELVLPTQVYQETLTRHLEPRGVTPFVSGVYQTQAMTQYLFSPDQKPFFPRLAEINALNAPFMLLALQARVTDKCVVEMAVLPGFKFKDCLGLDPLSTIMVVDLAGLDAAISRDRHRDSATTKRIRENQLQRLQELEATTFMHILISRHPDGTYATDAEILGVFDEINRSPTRRHDGR